MVIGRAGVIAVCVLGLLPGGCLVAGPDAAQDGPPSGVPAATEEAQEQEDTATRGRPFPPVLVVADEGLPRGGHVPAVPRPVLPLPNPPNPPNPTNPPNPPDPPPGVAVPLALAVLAPFAERVFVAGTFNDWIPEVHPLTRGDDGVWRGYVENARAGDHYKLVLDTAGGRLWKNDPRALAVTNSVGESVVVAPAALPDFTPVDWNRAVIYELHIGTFLDEPGGGPGTFDSASAGLDELQELGVTHVKVMPVAEFGGDFSWGYNPAHPFAVESAYGGLEGFRRFVQAAHSRGIAVILDVVYNHFGPSDLDLWRFDGWYENDLGGVYFYNDDRARTPWGHTRPDYGRPAVRDYLTDNALYWLRDVGVDGLRFDSTGNIRARLNGGMGDIPEGWQFLREVNAAVDRLPSWKVMIAEDLGGLGALTADVENGGAGFDAQWDPAFVHPVRHALITPSDDDRSMADLRTALAERVDADPFGRVIYTESHDEVANGRARVPEEIWPGNASSWFSRRRAVLGLVLTLTAPGVPMLFQGQEFLEDGWFSDTDPVDWSKRTTHADVRETTRTLIALRRNRDGHTRGLTGPHVNVFRVDEGAKLLGWHRFAEGGENDDVVVVARFRDGPLAWTKLGLPRCGRWTVRAVVADPASLPLAVNDTLVAGPEPADGLSCSAWVPLAAYGAVVLSAG